MKFQRIRNIRKALNLWFPCACKSVNCLWSMSPSIKWLTTCLAGKSITLAREIRQVGHEVSCCSHDAKHDLKNKECYKA